MQTSKNVFRIGTGILILLLLSNYCVAIVEPIDYKGTKIKIYSEKADREAIFNLLDKIPDKYFEGLGYIKFHSMNSKTYCGMYWWSRNGIDLFGFDCWNMAVLIHELSHDQQYIQGDTFPEAYHHSGRFYEFEGDIRKEARLWQE